MKSYQYPNGQKIATGYKPFSPQDPAIRERVEGLLARLTLEEKCSLYSGLDTWRTVPVERLGIPSLVMTDGPHGVRTQRGDNRIESPATSFPTGVSMAASWNPELVGRVAAALALETRALGCDILLGPCVNIVRGPLAGRNFEAYSEDPYLAGKTGVAFVNGLQSRRVGASLKHFACNNQEIERMRGNSVVDERTLREIYLSQFEMVVKEAKPWTVMTSYNRLNGEYAAENAHLLRDILKGEWGFEGVAISDWTGNHSTVDSTLAGLDIEMPGPAKYYGKLLVEAVDTWKVEEAVIDEGVRRILTMIALSGKFDDPALLPPGAVNTPEHGALARELAEESITLLKNAGGLLPLDGKKLRSVAVIGPNAAEARIGGGGSSYLEPPYRVSPLQGLKDLLGDGVEIRYEMGCDNRLTPPIVDHFYSENGQPFQTEVFASRDFSGSPAYTRADSKLSFWWWGTGPDENLNEGEFGARFSGRFVAPASGVSTFTLVNSDSARLWIDGKLVAEHHPGPVRPQEIHRNMQAYSASGTFEMAAGQAYDLVLEFARGKGVTLSVLDLAYSLPVEPEDDNTFLRAVELARASDVALVFAGMPTSFESEGGDRPHMDLPGPQEALIRAVAAANPRTVVVVNAGSPVTMPWVDVVPAIVEAYYPGQEGGAATARVLLGEVNPSGKLPVTFPARYADNPTYGNYPGARDVVYGEGLLVGYRYYDTKGVTPLFPFGHGLSYTTFEYSDLRVPARVAGGETFEVSLRVTNTGPRAGKEVAQLYVRDTAASLMRPDKELKGFVKVALQPGESQEVRFTLDPRALSFFDPARMDWVAEPGQFEIVVGASSRDLRLSATFELTE